MKGGLWPFGKKKAPVMGAGPGSSAPVDRVMSLSSQGLSEPEMIKVLREEGYSPVQVDSALKEALKGGAGGQAASPPRPSYPPPTSTRPREEPVETRPPAPSARPPESRAPRPYTPFLGGEEDIDLEEPEFGKPAFGEPGAGAEPPEFPEMMGVGKEFQPPAEEPPMPLLPGEEEAPPPIPKLPERRPKEMIREEKRRAVEELTEGIIEEKWKLFGKKIEEMDTKLRDFNNRIIGIEQKVNQIASERKSEVERIEDKIDTYKESMTEVTGRMESVESAMKDSLTPMMQTLRSLSETINKLKEKK